MKLKDINNAVLVWGIISGEGLKKIEQENCVVIVPENRPYLIGLKHNIPLFKKGDVRFVYCTDNTLGMLFYKDKIKKTIVFCGRQGEKNIGICGSLYVYLLSKLHNVPVEILTQGKTDFSVLDRDVSTLGHKNFVLEEDREDFVIESDGEVFGG